MTFVFRGSTLHFYFLHHEHDHEYIIDHDELIKRFGLAGVDVDFQDEKAENIARDFGKTALHLAAQFGNLPAVNALLSNGADINILDATKKTALNYAVEYHYNEKYCPKKYCHSKVIERLVCHLGKLEELNLQINRNNVKEKRKALCFLINHFFTYNYHLKTDVTALVNNAKNLLVVDQPKLFLSDYLSETGRGLVSYSFTWDAARREVIDKFFRDYNDDSKDVCKLQYRKAVKRVTLVKTAFNAMWKIAGMTVPIVCVEIIIRLLSNYDLENLIEASVAVDQNNIIDH